MEAALGELDGATAALVYVPHTTAGVTINEHADPAVARDFEAALERIVSEDWPWQHIEEGEENAPTHIRAAFMGSDVLVPVRDGRLALGTWQGIFLCEFDGPRERSVYVTALLDRGLAPHKAVREGPRRRRSVLPRRARTRHRLPRPERRRQDDHAARTRGAAPCDERRRDDPRAPLPRARGSVRTVGAILEANAFHPGRTGRNHLRTIAAPARIGDARVDEVLELVDLTAAANRRAKGYSLGMKQRLSLAGALLGDPQVLVLDEPANGLDPQGIRWLRDLLRSLAHEGRTVLVSSHVLTEMAQLADDVVIIAKGRLVTQSPMADVLAGGGHGTRVRSPERDKLAAALDAPGSPLARSATTRSAWRRRRRRWGRSQPPRGSSCTSSSPSRSRSRTSSSS